MAIRPLPPPAGEVEGKSFGGVVGALIERPAGKCCGFAEIAGKFVICHRRAIDNRPYILYRYIGSVKAMFIRFFRPAYAVVGDGFPVPCLPRRGRWPGEAGTERAKTSPGGEALEVYDGAHTHCRGRRLRRPGSEMV